MSYSLARSPLRLPGSADFFVEWCWVPTLSWLYNPSSFNWLYSYAALNYTFFPWKSEDPASGASGGLGTRSTTLPTPPKVATRASSHSGVPRYCWAAAGCYETRDFNRYHEKCIFVVQKSIFHHFCFLVTWVVVLFKQDMIFPLFLWNFGSGQSMVLVVK